jgi:hypothetical protein
MIMKFHDAGRHNRGARMAQKNVLNHTAERKRICRNMCCGA